MKRFLLMLILTAALLLPTSAIACPMCKDSIAETEAQAGSSLPGGFNASIYLMLGSFIGALGICGGAIVKGIKGGKDQT
jgi:hypothetical protein